MRVELPPEPVHFVNRYRERERVVRAVEEWRGSGRPLVVAFSGPAGLGKTELARLVARTVLDRYPDGVLTVDLDDHRVGGTLDPGDVLAQLLRSFGVEPALVEPQFKARCRQYWNLTADKRFVLLLDNARYASEVVPLLPASGACAVLVASPGPLYGLEDGAALDLALPPLDEDAATQLLELVARDPRLAEDPESVRALVHLCDGLPTALHVAGNWIRAHRLRPLARLLPELRGEWDEKGVPGVERVWDTAYGGLSHPASLLYRLLPHHPGPTFTPASATALLGLGEDACHAALEELHRAGLLNLDEGTRLRFPGPLHAHALRRGRADGEETDAGRVRVLRWYVRQAQRADLLVAGRRLTVGDTFPALPDTPDAEVDADWLYGERHALFACLRLAHARELDAEVVALAEPVWTYALDHPHQSDVVEVFRLAVGSAVRHGARADWIVRTRLQLARPLWESGRLDEAARELDAAEAAAGLLGDGDEDAKLRGSVAESKGMLLGVLGEWGAAVREFEKSLAIHAAVPNEYGVLLQTYRIGEARARLGELEVARGLLTEARAAAVEQKKERIAARISFALGGVVLRLGEVDEARELYEGALGRALRRGSQSEQARVHGALAELEAGAGREAEAAGHREAVEGIRRKNGISLKSAP
ncbi:NB-ARC domain-containing protein [Streptomyces acidiscabies]|uniref:NB-ARC domain-containing protein n=1 Tax=Streptomyces acidiscabies TaxID=42234 RepID=UPI0009525661|nr:NB-ARC domain-containing protein [Streptomyces acidiscabies]